jgi:MFS family permease
VSAEGVRAAIGSRVLWVPAWQRDFRLLWFGETTSNVGSSVTAVALPLVAVVTLHASTFTVGMLTAAAWLPWLLIGLPAGAWVDRLHRRPVMIACDIASTLLFASIPAAAWLGLLSIGQLLVVALLGGAATVFFATAYRVYLPSLLPPDRLLDGNAKLQGSESAARFAGPGIAGLLAQSSGAVTGLLLDAASFFVSAACLLAIRGREWPVPVTGRPGLRRAIADGMRYVARDRYLRTLTVFGAASNVALTGYQSILVVFLVRVVGLGAGTVGALLSVLSLGGVTGAFIAGRVARRVGTARGFLLCQLGAAPFALLIPLTGPGLRLAFLITGGLAIGVGVVAANVISGSFRQSYCPHHLLGRITTSMMFLNLGAIPLGGLLGGLLGTALGTRATIWIMAMTLVLAQLILIASPIRRGRDFPTGP